MKQLTILLTVILNGAGFADDAPPVSWPQLERVVLSEEFFSEGATFADINSDGHQDIVSGPFWYAGPDFRSRLAYTVPDPGSGSSPALAISGYSQHFFTFAADFNNDQRIDILAIPMPGQPAWWFRNPGPDADSSQQWSKHLALDGVGNESPAFLDITGDGQPELVCIHDGAYGYAAPNEKDPTAPWSFTPVTENRGFGAFTHGMGVGDVNGDNRPDLLESTGWWEQSAIPGALFKYHPFPFAQSGGSQILTCDFDGDGDNDVVSVQNAHAWGLKWFEQRGSDGDVAFIPHDILPDRYDAAAPLNISQMHSLALADLDGDGVRDIITGKRFYAHGGNDPGAAQLPVLYWFRTVRDGGGVHFEPRLIDERTGVGTQLTVGDLDGNGRPDIVVGNKLGTTIVLNTGAADGQKQLMPLMQQIGSDEYAQTIRTTEPLSPDEEKLTFVLPAGFEAQLVAAEPTIAKPMNMAFDARGRLWVTSSEEYPIAAPADRKGKDSIIVFEDTDGDGHRETATTFADGLNIPIGLYPYQDGVICFSIPNIWFLRDTDGDGKADQREKLYGPMGYERDTHGMCNGFTRGFDGWLYACHGFNNHTTVAGADGHQITMQSGNTFRMRTDGSRVEHFTHGLVNPFGMAQTAAGDLFVADCHTKPISLLIPGGYYNSFGKPHDGLGYVPDVMDHLHGSTAIGGIAIYPNGNGPGAFPRVYAGNAFGGNVMTGRINRNSLQPRGSGFQAREEPDFLICGDPWFRPVDLQIGPDGALYVADFYNRIIGHYEVKLDHPGRDRHRGRIWKIVYTGGDSRRDADQVSPYRSSAADDDPDALFRRLTSSSLTTRMLAMDRLTDSFPSEAIPLARSGLTHAAETVRVHSLWILQRLAKLDPVDIRTAISDRSSLVRTHAFRILLEGSDLPVGAAQWLQEGFADKSPIVRRAAVYAAARHSDQELLLPLIRLYNQTPSADSHLRHSIRMALRDHLRSPENFQHVAAVIEPADVPLIAGICLALDTEQAGNFLVRHIGDLGDSEPEVFAEYVKFAVRYVSAETVDQLTSVARERFRSDEDFQISLLQAAREGFHQRGTEIPRVMQDWAMDLTSALLNLQDGKLPDTDRQPIAWTYVPYAGTPDRGNPFVTTFRRTSADGMQKTPLISSFPQGEQWTGTYRSGPFSLDGPFSFYMAGHDGFPAEKPNGLNLVRLRDAATQETLQVWHPPRNDTAQRFEWTAPAGIGDSVYIEIVDGDTANAYAWLAVGRFSVADLNPGEAAERRHKGIALAGDFRLMSLRPVLAELLHRSGRDVESATRIARTLASLQPGSQLAAVSASISIAGMTGDLRAAAYETLVSGPAQKTPELIGSIMKVATLAEQFRVAQALCQDATGAALLVSLAERGQAAAELLRRPVIAESLNAFTDDQLASRILNVTRDLPDPNAAIEELIASRKQAYLQRPGSTAAGEALFTKNCAVCHQVAGKGKKVGPNLDGIGHRGLDRLVEDVLAPNRNVDIAFRSTTVVMASGKVASGLSKGFDGERLILVNDKGEERSIPREDIEEQVVSRRSPMPENVAELLTEEQFLDLTAWLLSLRK